MNGTWREAVATAVDMLVPDWCSERKLAESAGLAQSTVWRIRTGERRCRRRHLEALADGLGARARRCREAEAVLRRALEEDESVTGNGGV